jgi:AcrR family transcriptional regulator
VSRPPADKQTSLPSDTRGRLCMAALECIKRHGYEKTTMGDIAARAGIARPTLYKHFKSKQEILFAGIDSVALDFALSVAEHARQFGTLEERMIETIVYVVKEMPQHPYLSLIFDQEMSGALRERAFSDEATAVFAQITSKPLIEISPALAKDEIEISEIMSRFALSIMLFPGRYAKDMSGLRKLIKKRVVPGLVRDK